MQRGVLRLCSRTQSEKVHAGIRVSLFCGRYSLEDTPCTSVLLHQPSTIRSETSVRSLGETAVAPLPPGNQPRECCKRYSEFALRSTAPGPERFERFERFERISLRSIRSACWSECPERFLERMSLFALTGRSEWSEFRSNRSIALTRSELGGQSE